VDKDDLTQMMSDAEKGKSDKLTGYLSGLKVDETHEEFAPSAPPAIENAIGPLEDLYEELGSLDAVIEFVTQHLGGKYGDY